MLQAYFVSGVGEFVEEFFVNCQSVYFDQFASVWVCDKVVDTSDSDGDIPVLRLPECYGLISVSIV